MTNLRNNGPSEELVQFVNTKVVKNWDVIQNDISYATYNNIDRASINCGMFSEHIKATNSQDFNDRLPDHTIVIKESGLKLKESDSTGDIKTCLMSKNIVC